MGLVMGDAGLGTRPPYRLTPARTRRVRNSTAVGHLTSNPHHHTPCAFPKLAGTGESGKSTVFKQMKILYSVPDPPAKFLMVVRANLFGNAHAVFQGAPSALLCALHSHDNN